MSLSYWNQAFHFNTKNCITLLKDSGLVLVVLILIPPEIMCLKHVFYPKLRLVIQEPE